MDINLSPLVNTLVELGAVVLLAFGAYAIKRFINWIGLKEDSEVRVYLETALANAVKYGKTEVNKMGSDLDNLQVESETVTKAVNYVSSTVPDALKKLGVTPDHLETLIRARLENP